MPGRRPYCWDYWARQPTSAAHAFFTRGHWLYGWSLIGREDGSPREPQISNQIKANETKRTQTPTGEAEEHVYAVRSSSPHRWDDVSRADSRPVSGVDALATVGPTEAERVTAWRAHGSTRCGKARLAGPLRLRAVGSSLRNT